MVKFNNGPKVTLIARPQIAAFGMAEYLERVGGVSWADRVFVKTDIKDPELLVEFAGRLCYRSWEAGLNPNVTKVREDSAAYLRNILSSGHGSVLEHAQFSFVIENCSRVFTHEQVRHRAGVAYSQESMRYVRLTEIPFWVPGSLMRTPEGKSEDEHDAFLSYIRDLLEAMEAFQVHAAEYYGLDDEGVGFAHKKAITSALRRFAPIGVSTALVLSANIRAIRHMIEMRTAEAAEEEIRAVYSQIGQIMVEEAPLLFGDYEPQADGSWKTPYGKV